MLGASSASNSPDILTIVLVVAVILSLGLSITTLILQIMKSRSQQTPIAKARANPNKPPAAPPPQDPVYPAAPSPQRSWTPPMPPVMQDDDERTEAMFSSSPQAYAMGGGTDARQNAAYHLFVKEFSSNGEFNHEFDVMGEFTIGRSPSSGLRINHATVSGVHCVLIAGPDSVFVCNRSQSNIAQLNGVMLNDTRQINPGDTLILGHVQLSIMDVRKYAAR